MYLEKSFAVRIVIKKAKIPAKIINGRRVNKSSNVRSGSNFPIATAAPVLALDIV